MALEADLCGWGWTFGGLISAHGKGVILLKPAHGAKILISARRSSPIQSLSRLLALLVIGRSWGTER